MKASKLPPIWALNLFYRKKWKFKITPYLSTLSSNSNHSLNLSINVSIDQCWILFPTINVNLSFVKAKQMENVMAKKSFFTECSRILSQPLKKKKSKRMQRKTICTRACSFCFFRSIDSYSDQNSWISQPILTEKNESFKITPYLSTQSIYQCVNYLLFEHSFFKFKPFAQSIYQCVNWPMFDPFFHYKR